ncbi:hypothetical protein [Paenibacillus massiliensis]|uniref:hypothetical protein n=1 Tax=Paenibacillus massiliensis TaxID=225917 RepID=UPI0004913FFB|nr:hypothetical protein [Paenibacillus massiliensis]
MNDNLSADNGNRQCMSLVPVESERLDQVRFRNGRVSQFSAYAPPLVWGPWRTVREHTGAATYEVGYRAEGEILVVAEIRYYSLDRGRVEQGFIDQVSIQTGDVMDIIEVRFKGGGMGTGVTGTVYGP